MRTLKMVILGMVVLCMLARPAHALVGWGWLPQDLYQYVTFGAVRSGASMVASAFVAVYTSVLLSPTPLAEDDFPAEEWFPAYGVIPSSSVTGYLNNEIGIPIGTTGLYGYVSTPIANALGDSQRRYPINYREGTKTPEGFVNIAEYARQQIANGELPPDGGGGPPPMGYINWRAQSTGLRTVADWSGSGGGGVPPGGITVNDDPWGDEPDRKYFAIPGGRIIADFYPDGRIVFTYDTPNSSLNGWSARFMPGSTPGTRTLRLYNADGYDMGGFNNAARIHIPESVDGTIEIRGVPNTVQDTDLFVNTDEMLDYRDVPRPQPSAFPDPSWVEVGRGDFNGDGYIDIAWRGPDGTVYIGMQQQNSLLYVGSPGSRIASWIIVGVGDFNGDGRADILWYNTGSRQLSIWFMNGATKTSSGSPGTLAGGRLVKGVGDFNGDGKADILLYDPAGYGVYIWEMNGLSIIGQGQISTLDPSWSVASVSDVNLDGYADIIWQHSSGYRAAWFVQGLAVVGSTSLPSSCIPSSACPPYPLGDPY